MSRRIRARSAACLLTALAVMLPLPLLAQSNSPSELQAAQPHALGPNPAAGNQIGQSSASTLLRVPLGNTTPGAISPDVNIKNPAAGDPQSAARGMKYFIGFNCVGCHAANGGGGMGPALSDASMYKYPTDPASLFLVIYHGAPLGMPAWGTVLPESVIWDIVSYLESINKTPQPAWGTTVAASEHLPGIQQVPAEFKQSPTPWNFTEPFTDGRAPSGQNPPSAGSP